MQSYCLKCKLDTDSKNSRVLKTSAVKIMHLSKYAVYNSKKSIFLPKSKCKWVIKPIRKYVPPPAHPPAPPPL